MDALASEIRKVALDALVEIRKSDTKEVRSEEEIRSYIDNNGDVDSLDSVELIMFMERVYKINIPDMDSPGLRFDDMVKELYLVVAQLRPDLVERTLPNKRVPQNVKWTLPHESPKLIPYEARGALSRPAPAVVITRRDGVVRACNLLAGWLILNSFQPATDLLGCSIDKVGADLISKGRLRFRNNQEAIERYAAIEDLLQRLGPQFRRGFEDFGRAVNTAAQKEGISYRWPRPSDALDEIDVYAPYTLQIWVPNHHDAELQALDFVVVETQL